MAINRIGLKYKNKIDNSDAYLYFEYNDKIESIKMIDPSENSIELILNELKMDLKLKLKLNLTEMDFECISKLIGHVQWDQKQVKLDDPGYIYDKRVNFNLIKNEDEDEDPWDD